MSKSTEKTTTSRTLSPRTAETVSEQSSAGNMTDGEDNKFTRARVNSFSKGSTSELVKKSGHARRLSGGAETTRPRSSTTTDVTRSPKKQYTGSHTHYDSLWDPEISTNKSSTNLQLLEARPDISFLNSTLQSINRIKEEKEFLIEDGTIKGGSLTAIVLWLVENAGTVKDRNLILCFLVCLPRYTVPEQLLGLLHEKFKEQQQLLESGDNTREKSINATLSFFALWFDSYFKRDFQMSACLVRTEQFLIDVLAAGFVEWHRRCKLIILRRSGYELKSLLFTSSNNADDVAKAKKGKRLSSKKRSHSNAGLEGGPVTFEALTAADIAEQLTLREWEIFRTIPDSDFLDKVWLQKPPVPNSQLCKMIDHFNLISLWAASSIIHIEDLKERANALKKILQVCDLLFELGNFNGLMEIIAGLSMGAVQRLTKTWSLAGSGPRAVYEKFANIMTTKLNFQTYRHALLSTKMPAVPYVGVLLRDLVFIEEGNPLKLQGTAFFNFDRIHLLGRLILEIQKYKRIPYDIPVLPMVQAYFASIKPMENDDALYAASLAAESDAP